MCVVAVMMMSMSVGGARRGCCRGMAIRGPHVAVRSVRCACGEAEQGVYLCDGCGDDEYECGRRTPWMLQRHGDSWSARCCALGPVCVW